MTLPIDFEQHLTTTDLQDSRDYIYEEHFTGEEANGDGTIRDKYKMAIRDQYDQPETYKACTNYALC
jgi:hypothetical protein